MATFRAYAKVLEPDDPTMRIYEAGLRACPGEPGMPLAEVLRRSGGAYQTTTPLIPDMRDDIREVAELTSDAELLKIAELTEVPVSLEHLRGLDPQTRIIITSELSYEGDEASRVSAATRSHHALATVMPDGTVIQGDARPLGRPGPHPQVTDCLARRQLTWPGTSRGTTDGTRPPTSAPIPPSSGHGHSVQNQRASAGDSYRWEVTTIAGSHT